ncbi:UNVERIFIED_CONTAM: hypothetical protein GTU68_011174, partial [Idotea baltica]|nr:hypothetical protein [Idotea baltica]
MSIQAVVLLSGGLDSVYNLYRAHKKWGEGVVAVHYNYGQKAWAPELEAAKTFCSHLKVDLQVVDISSVFEGGKSSLTNQSNLIPTSEVDILSEAASIKSAEKVWVANRNGVLLNVAACLAEKLGASWIVPGFNAEEAATFPDNSVDYIEKMNACLKLSTANGVQIRCFSQAMQKSEIIKDLSQMNANIETLWSCYFGGD